MESIIGVCQIGKEALTNYNINDIIKRVIIIEVNYSRS